MIPYALIRSKRRSIAIQIHPNGEVVVRAPLRTSIDFIEDFINRKQGWIKKHQANRENRPNPESVNDTKNIYYLGKSYTIICSNVVWKVILDLETGSVLIPRQYSEAIISHLHEWYRESARTYIIPRIQEMMHQYDFSDIGKIRISSARTRWGSCNHVNTLSFSLFLMQYPKETIDAVILHELAHTREKNHSIHFWNIVYAYMPDYDIRTKPLRKGII